jgi:hypothetical protein
MPRVLIANIRQLRVDRAAQVGMFTPDASTIAGRGWKQPETGVPPREVGSTLTLGRPLAPPITAWVEFSALGLVTAIYTGMVTAKHGHLPCRFEEGRGDLSAPSRFEPAPGLEAVVHGAVHKRCEVDAAVTSIVDAAASRIWRTCTRQRHKRHFETVSHATTFFLGTNGRDR